MKTTASFLLLLTLLAVLPLRGSAVSLYLEKSPRKNKSVYVGTEIGLRTKDRFFPLTTDTNKKWQFVTRIAADSLYVVFVPKEALGAYLSVARPRVDDYYTKRERPDLSALDTIGFAIRDIEHIYLRRNYGYDDDLSQLIFEILFPPLFVARKIDAFSVDHHPIATYRLKRWKPRVRTDYY
jgi:hypothetical protein